MPPESDDGTARDRLLSSASSKGFSHGSVDEHQRQHHQDVECLLDEDGKSTNTRSLNFCHKASYSVGHVLNDLTASVWFTYMLVYLQQVVGFSPKVAGNLILLGQVTDAIFNPIIGYISDRDCASCSSLCDRRKRWHFIGSLFVCLSFPCILVFCLGCESEVLSWQHVAFYVIFIITFQFGWAAAQIAHLSLIGELSQEDEVRLELNAMRYGGTVLSNMFVYGVAWAFFGSVDLTNKIQKEDAQSFRNLAVTVTCTGAFMCMMFYVGTPKPLGSEEFGPHKQCVNKRTPIKQWLSDPMLYILAFLYMAARLVVNLTQVYIPFYVTETLGLQKEAIAIYPLVMYVCSFLTTVIIKALAKRVSSEMVYMWGAFTVIAGCTWMVFLQHHLVLPTFGTAILGGIGGAAVMITSLSMLSDFIGDNQNSSAFIFGAMGFFDKLCNGLAVFIIQMLSPCNSGPTTSVCINYSRIAIGIIPAVVAALSLPVLALSVRFKVVRRRTAMYIDLSC